MKYQIKLITGFRKDQDRFIDAEEAHKAYYLFNNPEARTTFSNGLAIRGDEIKEILPDFIGTMGWNPTHQLDSDDWNEIRSLGVDTKLQKYLSVGKEVARMCAESDLHIPLSELVKGKYQALVQPKERQGTIKKLSEVRK